MSIIGSPYVNCLSNLEFFFQFGVSVLEFVANDPEVDSSEHLAMHLDESLLLHHNCLPENKTIISLDLSGFLCFL